MSIQGSTSRGGIISHGRGMSAID